MRLIQYLFILTLVFKVALYSQAEVDKEKNLKDTGLTSDVELKATVKALSRKKAVLILPVKSSVTDTPSSILNKSDDLLNQTILQLGRFQVVDRKSLKKALAQISLSTTGLIPEEKQLEMGKMVGATEILSLEILEYSVKQKKMISSSAVAGNVLSALLKQAGAGGIIKERDAMQVQWVIELKYRLIHKELASGDKLAEETISCLAFDEFKGNAEAALDSQIASQLTHSLKNLFPLKSFIVKVDEREITIRLGQDLGLTKNMKFFVYSNLIKDQVSSPLGEIRLTEIFPTLSLANLRIKRGTIKPEMPVVERNTLDVQFGFLAGVAPLQFSMGSFNQFNTFATIRSTKSNEIFGLSDWVDTLTLPTTRYDLVPQLALNFSKELGSSAIDLRLATLLALPALGFKSLLGYKVSILDIDFFNLGFSAHVGGAGFWLPLGKIKSGFYLPADGANIENNVEAGSLLSAVGLTFGGELAAQIGVNLGYSCKLVAEIGYDYYLPINRFSVMTTDKENKLANLTKYFETSRVGPVDLTGLSLSASLTFMF